MRRLLASALGAMALSWMCGGVSAQQPDSVLPRTYTTGQAKGGEAIAAPVQAGPSCGAGGCNYYDQACGNDNCGGGGGHIIGGLGLYLIQPYFNTNPAYNTKLTNATGTTIHTEQHDFHQGWDGAPEAWIGYVSECGFGARIRYFQYAQTANFGITVPDFGGPANKLTVSSANPLGLGISPFNVAKGDQFNFSSHLGILVWDFEFMQTWNPGCWQLTGSAGLRYAHVSQGYGVTTNLLNPVGNEQPNSSATLSSGHSFNGAGPTVALEGRRAIGCSGLAVYANARGSILFGSDYQHAFLTTVPTVFPVPDPNADAFQHEANVLPVGEVEIGAEFGRDMGRVRAMFQIGFTGQVWFGAGNASNSGGLGLVGTATPINTPTNNTNLGLAGMVIRAGLSY